MSVEPICEDNRPEINRILTAEWHGSIVISRGRAIDTSLLPGFIYWLQDRIAGVATYRIEQIDCEIVTLNSLIEHRGIGIALLDAVRKTAIENGCHRLWLITTNDNLRAFGFYQKYGFELAAIHLNAIDRSRELKPAIPQFGMEHIPIKHELEFEIRL